MAGQDFITKATHKHQNFYDYGKVTYINSHTKVIIICPAHGDFWQAPTNHLGGVGCPKCGQIKRKQTCMERYGAYHNWCAGTSSRKKYEQTIIEKYGVSNPFLSEKIKKKQRLTMLNRHGNAYSGECLHLLSKMWETNVEKYGVKCPLQSKSIKQKAEQTNLERYGTRNSNQKHMLLAVSLLEDKDWLYQQYVTENKTATQIGNELHVSGPTIGNYLRCHNIDIKPWGTSYISILWLQSIMEKQNVYIQHKGNCSEFYISGVGKVDGYCKELNTVYEFHGDLFHGNPNIYDSAHETFFYKTSGDLYQQTMERENKIRELGYNLVTIWESDFLTHLKELEPKQEICT